MTDVDEEGELVDEPWDRRRGILNERYWACIAVKEGGGECNSMVVYDHRQYARGAQPLCPEHRGPVEAMLRDFYRGVATPSGFGLADFALAEVPEHRARCAAWVISPGARCRHPAVAVDFAATPGWQPLCLAHRAAITNVWRDSWAEGTGG
ncbi:MAG: hypothetical protein ACRD0D_07930 [Acidimicrobiales bacterium]